VARFPRLKRPEVLQRLLRRECLVRKQCGDEPTVGEYRERFPELEIPEWDVDASNEAAGLDETRRVSPSATDATPLADAPTAEYSKRFGNYDLLDEIGRGGMGVVYRARQRSADRIVALKVIRRELLQSLVRDTTTGALERFHHEVQAAARLEHDHLVSVYEVGDVAGEPFFSMQYVDGESLGEILRTGPVESRRAARYLEQVARAVAAAHREGILHRDLKPQNILVDTKTDRPLVVDFGLAKLQGSCDELTRSGDVMGSPPYMSPEQARDSSRVTAQSDVYALGATMYHLLTGRPPFQAATVLETIRQVIDEEPVPPRKLNPLIDRDAETICLKCLEKHVLRRYASGETLAEDLRRYLDHKPIQARPIGPLGRCWRWCLRNPVTAASLALAVAFLIAALVAATVGYLKTSASLAVANQAKKQSDESFRQARSAVDRFFTHVSENELLDLPGMQPLRRELLEEAIAYYERFLKQRGDDPSIRDELAATHFRVGRIRELIEAREEALQAYQQARTAQRQLLAERPDDRLRLAALGDTANAMGRVLHRLEDFEGALTAYREAVKARERLAELAPEVAEYRRTLANTYMNIGLVERLVDFERARQWFERAQTIRAELVASDSDSATVRRDQAKGDFNFAVLEIHAGREAADTQQFGAATRHFEAAEQRLRAAIDAFEKLLQTGARGLDNRHSLATCYRLLGDLKSDTRQTEEALRLYEQSREQMVLFALTNPDVAEYRATLAGLHMNVGFLHVEQGQTEPALAALADARDLLEPLVADFPATPLFRADLALTLQEIGQLLKGSDQTASRNSLQAAKRHFEQLVKQCPNNDDFRRELQVTEKALRALKEPAEDGK